MYILYDSIQNVGNTQNEFMMTEVMTFWRENYGLEGMDYGKDNWDIAHNLFLDLLFLVTVIYFKKSNRALIQFCMISYPPIWKKKKSLVESVKNNVGFKLIKYLKWGVKLKKHKIMCN